MIRKNNVPWPKNLVLDIADDDSFFDKHPAPHDFITSVYYVIGQLSEREESIIFDRYLHNMTLDAIAERNGVTRERIRQVLARALRKLKNPVRFRFIEKGISATLRSDLNNDILIKNGCDEVAREECIMDLKFEDLGLSVRTFNAILRAAYTKDLLKCRVMTKSDITLGMFIGVTDEQLLHVRNLGHKSLEELITTLKRFDIHMVNGELVYKPTCVTVKGEEQNEAECS